MFHVLDSKTNDYSPTNAGEFLDTVERYSVGNFN